MQGREDGKSRHKLYPSQVPSGERHSAATWVSTPHAETRALGELWFSESIFGPGWGLGDLTTCLRRWCTHNSWKIDRCQPCPVMVNMAEVKIRDKKARDPRVCVWVCTRVSDLESMCIYLHTCVCQDMCVMPLRSCREGGHARGWDGKSVSPCTHWIPRMCPEGPWVARWCSLERDGTLSSELYSVPQPHYQRWCRPN